MSSLFAVLKFVGFAVLCVLMVPLQALVMVFSKDKAAYILPKFWHQCVCALFGLRASVTGTPHQSSQVIYVSNHLSYLDIPLLGAHIPNASFVSKNDVANWPVWGFLSSLQQTAFISRSRGDTQKEAHSLDQMIANGKNLIIFPEGTSTFGRDVLPFKSSLFSLAFKNGPENLRIQPLSIELRRANKQEPSGDEARLVYTWPREDDRDLHIHLWDLAKTSGAELHITFHPVIRANEFSDRKTLAKTCHDTVCKGLSIQNAA